METYIRASGYKTEDTDMGFKLQEVANDTKVNSSRIKRKAKELLSLVMETFTREAGTRIKDMALV